MQVKCGALACVTSSLLLPLSKSDGFSRARHLAFTLLMSQTCISLTSSRTKAMNFRLTDVSVCAAVILILCG